MSAFLDETGTLITVSSSNPLPVGGKSLTSTCIFTRLLTRQLTRQVM